jgi:hypothetical protein
MKTTFSNLIMPSRGLSSVKKCKARAEANENSVFKFDYPEPQPMQLKYNNTRIERRREKSAYFCRPYHKIAPVVGWLNVRLDA